MSSLLANIEAEIESKMASLKAFVTGEVATAVSNSTTLSAEELSAGELAWLASVAGKDFSISDAFTAGAQFAVSKAAASIATATAPAETTSAEQVPAVEPTPETPAAEQTPEAPAAS